MNLYRLYYTICVDFRLFVEHNGYSSDKFSSFASFIDFDVNLDSIIFWTSTSIHISHDLWLEFEADLTAIRIKYEESISTLSLYFFRVDNVASS